MMLSHNSLKFGKLNGLNKLIFKFWGKKVRLTDLKVSCVFFFSVAKTVSLEVAEISRRVTDSRDLLCGWAVYEVPSKSHILTPRSICLNK